MSPPRIALLGFAIECNRFAPDSTEADFSGDVDLSGEDILAEARKTAPGMTLDLPGFVAEMDRSGPWTALPLRVAQAQPGGPVEDGYFRRLMAAWQAGLVAAAPLDGVYVTCHGAALTTASDDPDGEMLEMVRHMVGPAVPVVATFDLHANVSRRMVDNLSVFVGYRCNPHTDIRERGVEAAQHMREVLAGTKTEIDMVKIPLVAPQVSLLTAEGPYADVMNYGLSKVGGTVMNVSVMAGFSYSDSPKNGLTAIVTTRGDAKAARELALDICRRAWDMRARFKRQLTPLSEAVRLAAKVGRDSALEPIILADVADNPGGGGRGNTTELLRALSDAGVQGAIFGVFNDATLSAEAHRLGIGKSFEAAFNTAESQEFSRPWSAPATVRALSDGKFVGRRGLARGMACDMGPSALLDLGGIALVVISNRQQCLDPMQFELLGVDPAKARTIVVKSRGHFRAGFDGFVPTERTYEVDCPGLTSPNFATFRWTRLPRPVYPLDEHTSWTPPGA